MSHDWFIQHLRFSLLGLKTKPDPDAAWQALQWAEPHKQTHHLRNGITEWSTCNERWIHMLRVTDKRIDVFQQANVKPKARFADFTSLQPCSKQIEAFATTVSPLATCAPVDRVALGGQLWISGPELADCAQVLDGYLQSVKIPPNGEQFMYRINHPLQTGEHLLNRIMTWSTNTRRHVTFQPDGSHKQTVEHLAQLVLDVSNKSRETTLLSKEAVENLLITSKKSLQDIVNNGEPS